MARDTLAVNISCGFGYREMTTLPTWTLLKGGTEPRHAYLIGGGNTTALQIVHRLLGELSRKNIVVVNGNDHEHICVGESTDNKRRVILLMHAEGVADTATFVKSIPGEATNTNVIMWGTTLSGSFYERTCIPDIAPWALYGEIPREQKRPTVYRYSLSSLDTDIQAYDPMHHKNVFFVGDTSDAAYREYNGGAYFYPQVCNNRRVPSMINHTVKLGTCVCAVIDNQLEWCVVKSCTDKQLHVEQCRTNKAHTLTYTDYGPSHIMALAYNGRSNIQPMVPSLVSMCVVVCTRDRENIIRIANTVLGTATVVYRK